MKALRDIRHVGRIFGSRDYNLPTQKAVKGGYLRIVEFLTEGKKGKILTYVTKVTPKGQQYYMQKFGAKSTDAENEEQGLAPSLA